MASGGSVQVSWRTNLRTNLVLWPDVSGNIAALAQCEGEVYDESALLSRFPAGEGEKSPTDARAVRNTFEVMALAGLAYRTEDDPPRLRLTELGRSLFSFLGVVGGTRFANEANRAIVADALIRAGSVVIEQRAIWMLMRRTEGLLTNEELNRAMARVHSLADVTEAAKVVREARRKSDPTIIGARLYENESYADSAKREDQRKALNPLFLLAGGGRMFISLEPSDPYRRLEEWAVPLIDRRLQEPVPLIHASTDADIVRLISDQACLPIDIRRNS